MSAPPSPLSSTLQRVVVCPLDYGALVFLEKKHVLACESCGKEFPFEKGIPRLLP
ncbi:MAG: Trm112 family protein [archaeon]